VFHGWLPVDEEENETAQSTTIIQMHKTSQEATAPDSFCIFLLDNVILP
jgi:hypothetical protein